jgi:hypothetical protein
VVLVGLVSTTSGSRLAAQNTVNAACLTIATAAAGGSPLQSVKLTQKKLKTTVINDHMLLVRQAGLQGAAVPFCQR